MHEFHHGELEGNAGPVRHPRQAIAIALSEAGASCEQMPRQNRRRLARADAPAADAASTRKRTSASARTAEAPGRPDGASRAELYAQAQQRGIKGRSRMSQAELHPPPGAGKETP